MTIEQGQLLWLPVVGPVGQEQVTRRGLRPALVGCVMIPARSALPNCAGITRDPRPQDRPPRSRVAPAPFAPAVPPTCPLFALSVRARWARVLPRPHRVPRGGRGRSDRAE